MKWAIICISSQSPAYSRMLSFQKNRCQEPQIEDSSEFFYRKRLPHSIPRPSKGPRARWGRSVGCVDEIKHADIEGPENGGFGAFWSRLETFSGSERCPIIPVIIQTINIDLGEGQEALSDHQEGLHSLKKKMREVTAWLSIVHCEVEKL